MTNLEKKLNENYGDGLFDTNAPIIQVQIGKESRDSENLTVWILEETSSGGKYTNIKTEEDVGNALAEYIKNYMMR